MTEQFRTFRGYTLKARAGETLSPSMEDYLEMAYRLWQDQEYLRVNDLAAALSVRPPSASRAVSRLASQGYIDYQPYGLLQLTEKGKELGKALLTRHNLVQAFLSSLGVKENLLQDTERIEHLLSAETLDCMAGFVEYAQANPEWLKQLGTQAEAEPTEGGPA